MACRHKTVRTQRRVRIAEEGKSKRAGVGIIRANQLLIQAKVHAFMATNASPTDTSSMTVSDANRDTGWRGGSTSVDDWGVGDRIGAPFAEQKGGHF